MARVESCSVSLWGFNGQFSLYERLDIGENDQKDKYRQDHYYYYYFFRTVCSLVTNENV